METQTYIITCPHCGHERRASFCKESWPDTDYTLWSDGRIESDGWFEPTRTQQCPHCGKFFIRQLKTELLMVDEPCTDRAILSYQQLKTAINELAGTDFAEGWARHETWQAYNALYQDADLVPEEEQEFNRSNMQWLVDDYTPRPPKFSSLVFELNRLLGHRDVCERMLQITCEEYIQQKKEFHILRGRPWDDDKEKWERRYNNLMKELKSSLDLPLKPYKGRN